MNIDTEQFKKCPECSGKTEKIWLCNSCSHNQSLIASLKAVVSELRKRQPTKSVFENMDEHFKEMKANFKTSMRDWLDDL